MIQKMELEPREEGKLYAASATSFSLLRYGRAKKPSLNSAVVVLWTEGEPSPRSITIHGSGSVRQPSEDRTNARMDLQSKHRGYSVW